MHAFLLAATLLATPNFPAAMQRDLGLQAPPRCSVCHATESGGAGTVVQPFGVYLLSRGLRAYDESSLRNALLAAAGEAHTSNGDGVLDADALKQGLNPNAPKGTEGGSLTPAYGCSSGGAVNLWAAVALAIWFCARRAQSNRHHKVI